MEGQIDNSSTGMGKFILPTVVVALIVFAAIGFYLTQSSNTANNTMDQINNTADQTASPDTQTGTQTNASYKDGKYSVTGNYVSPGGPRTLNVTLTLSNSVVTDAVVEATATDATSKRFQGEFVDNFKPMVIGKNINEVTLTKVSGSSLSPKGFNDAVEQIKTEAKV